MECLVAAVFTGSRFSWKLGLEPLARDAAPTFPPAADNAL